jgi:uncharacterized protein YndB with AHSA1/START domain
MRLHQASAEVIHVSATLNCEPKQAFEFFTRNSLLESWLTSHAEVEPRLGGKYELFWNPNDRENDSTIGCKVTSVVEPWFLSFTWKGPKEFKRFMNEFDPLTHVSVFFLPLVSPSAARTEVHLIHSGWRNLVEWQGARDYFARNWMAAFEKLEGRAGELPGPAI